MIEDGIEEFEIELDLDSKHLWQPTRIDELMEHIYEHCINELKPLITESIKHALETAPTYEAERELIEVVSGREHVRKRYDRERVIFNAVLSSKTDLPDLAKVLIDLRYREEEWKLLYAEVSEGEISSAWRWVEDLLPKEIIKLIAEDD